MPDEEHQPSSEQPPRWGFIPVELFAREQEVTKEQVEALIKEVGTFRIKYKDHLSSNQTSFLRAHMRKKGIGKFDQEPLDQSEIAWRLKSSVKQIESDGTYAKYLDAFAKKALEKRRINNNALLRTLGYKPCRAEGWISMTFLQGGAPGLKR